MNKPLRILMIGGSENDTISVIHELSRAGYSPSLGHADSKEKLLEFLNLENWDIIIAEYKQALELWKYTLQRLKEKEIETPVIFLVDPPHSEVKQTKSNKFKANHHYLQKISPELFKYNYIQRRNLELLPAIIEREIELSRSMKDYKKYQTLSQMQVEISDVLATDVPLIETIKNIIATICSHISFDYAGYLVVDPDEKILKNIYTYRTNRLNLDDFENMSKEIPFALGAGTLGLIWEQKNTMWTLDLVKEGNALRKRAAERSGLHTAVAFPILHKETVFGIIEFVSSEIRPPDKELIAFFQNVGIQIGFLQEQLEIRRALSESERKYRGIVEMAQEGIWQIDQMNKTVFVNKRLSEMLALTTNEIIGLPFVSFLDREGKSICSEYLWGPRKTGTHETDIKIFRKDGSYFWAYISVTPLLEDNKEYRGAVILITDITDRKNAENALKESEEQYRDLVQSAPFGIFIHVDGVVKFANKPLLDMIGVESFEKAPKKMIFDFIDPELWPLFRERMDLLNKGISIPPIELKIKKPNGEKIEVSAHSAPTLFKGEQGVVVILTDISETKKAKKEVEFLILHDPLTGLPNRQQADINIAKLIDLSKDQETAFAVFSINVDNFKIINDSFGHPVGDEILKLVAKKLVKIVGKKESLARLGADQFIVIQENVSRNELTALLAQQLLDVFTEPFEVMGKAISLKISIGISLYPQDGTLSTQLLKNADLALTHAKESGGGIFQYFSDDLSKTMQKKVELIEILRKSFAENKITLFYQPIVSLLNNEIIGIEGLLRLQGNINLPASEFIPVAEDLGLLEVNWNSILEICCQKIKNLHDQGFNKLYVSINLSARQFRNLELLKTIHNALERFQLTPGALQLEITESTIIHDVNFARSLLNQLQKIGVRIAIDDFGTGYSSLSYLKLFKVDVLKIDKSFIDEITQKSSDASIVNLIIMLGHSLGLHITAEGVETEAQLTLLRTFKCDSAQGFYLSHPISEKRINELISSGLTINK